MVWMSGHHADFDVIAVDDDEVTVLKNAFEGS
mgnify:CR=1 FL=1